MGAMTHVHFIGIGGSGLSAIARVLLESGQMVSGSDRQNSPMLADLQAAGARVFTGHRPENLEGADIVIRSSAVTDDNIEVQTAKLRGIPVMKRSDYLGQLMVGRVGIAVAGTHGKTTTTAMIAWMLRELGQDPTYITGGIIKGLETNAGAGKGHAFVIEADEYDGMFLGLNPQIAVVTNLEHDHPDCYPTVDDYRQAFATFAGRLADDGLLLACGDDPGAAWLLKEAADSGVETLSYGISTGEHTYIGRSLTPNNRGGFSFDFLLGAPLVEDTVSLVHAQLSVPGEHNVRNALAALAVAHLMQLPLEDAAQSLTRYPGTSRRFEVLGEAEGVVVIDDYAHHPSEIKATLMTARAHYPDKELWAVWQPHTYSRTQALLDDFGSAFYLADHVLVTEIYASREAPPISGFSGNQVAAAIQRDNVHFTPELSQAVSLLLDQIQPGSVLLIMSAGDANQVGARVLQGLLERSREDA
jgi:UDP-N-acetylmuramate--alanine ligase